MVRVYFNAKGNPDTAWSVDLGTQETERHFAGVVVFGEGHSVYTGDKPNPISPVAWIQFDDASITIAGRKAVIPG